MDDKFLINDGYRHHLPPHRRDPFRRDNQGAERNGHAHFGSTRMGRTDHIYISGPDAVSRYYVAFAPISSTGALALEGT